jgi:CubicO group peptidase (beta-lactamase class C family)
LRHVLQHRSGPTTVGTTLGDAIAMNGWARIVRRAERAPLRTPPGSRPAYQYLLYGFLLGEAAQRVTGTPLPELVDALVLEPAGCHRTHLGLPDGLVSRAGPVRAPGARGAVLAAAVNRPATRTAVNPSAGFSTTARDLAMLYHALLDGRVVTAPTLAEATTPTSDGETDAFAHRPIRWSQGFQLGRPRWVPGTFSPMGRTPSWPSSPSPTIVPARPGHRPARPDPLTAVPGWAA